MYDALSSFNFLAIPLFIFAGALLSEGGVAKNLMDLASATIGRGRGGMGVSVIASTMLFSGISGSSSADTAAISKVSNPSAEGTRLSGAVSRRSVRFRRMRWNAYSADQRPHSDWHRGKHVHRRPFRRRDNSGDREWPGAYGVDGLCRTAQRVWQRDHSVFLAGDPFGPLSKRHRRSC